MSPHHAALQDLEVGSPNVTTKAGVANANCNLDKFQEAEDAMMTPSQPAALQDLKVGSPKVTTKAGVANAN